MHLISGLPIDCSLYIPPNSQGDIFSFLTAEKDYRKGRNIARNVFREQLKIITEVLYMVPSESKELRLCFFCEDVSPILSDEISQLLGQLEEIQVRTVKVCSTGDKKFKKFTADTMRIISDFLLPFERHSERKKTAYGLLNVFKKFIPREYTTELDFRESVFLKLCTQTKTLQNLDRKGIKAFLDSNFLSWQESLIMVPHHDWLVSSDQSEFTWRTNTKRPRGQILPFDYVGEIEKFYPQLHSWKQSPKGILLRNYSHEEFLPLLKTSSRFSFEFDWVYFSPESVTLIEVTTNEKVKNKRDFIMDKILQMRKQITELKSIVYNILFRDKSGVFDGNFSFQKFFDERFKCVIFFANIPHKALSLNLETILNEVETESNLESLLFAGTKEFADDLQTLYLYDTTKGKLSTSSLNSESGFSELIEDVLGVFTLGYFCESKGYKTSHMHSKCDMFPEQELPMTVKYKKCQKKFFRRFQNLHGNKQSLCFIDYFDTPLSTQQLGILLTNPKFLCCIGDAGTGKTTLLLAKALMCALDSSVERIHFFVPFDNWLLRKIITGYRERYSDIIHSKFQLQDSLWFLSDVLMKSSQYLRKTVIFLDGIYYQDEKIVNDDLRNLMLRTGPLLQHFWFTSMTMEGAESETPILQKFCR